MMLLEHDAKELLASIGLPIPRGVLASTVSEAAAISPPVVIKAQVPVGGRGKAGGIRMARSEVARDQAVGEILRMHLKGHPVRAVRLEQPVNFVAETYLSLAIEPGSCSVRVLISPQGGVDVESEAARSQLRSGVARLDPNSIRDTLDQLSDALPQNVRNCMRNAGRGLIAAFFAFEAILIEINPLFICADGSWVIGDTKLLTDDNAFERQPALKRRIEAQPLLYPQAALKLSQGYDFVALDEGGDIGLVTTGAGLSMQLIDELVARGHRPFNFCDIRTGMFRGDPGRLIQVLRWIAQAPNIRTVLVNFFAGLTDLAEIATLLLRAIEQVPELKVPVIARLIGHNLDQALGVIAAAGSPITVETDLERAIDLAVHSLRK